MAPRRESNDQHSAAAEYNIIMESTADYNVIALLAFLLQVSQFLSLFFLCCSSSFFLSSSWVHPAGPQVQCSSYVAVHSSVAGEGV